jgi:amino acid transporter
MQQTYVAWTTAPSAGGLKIILDIPALGIVAFITWLVYRGIHESKTAANWFVYLKLAVILLVIVAGAFYVNPDNWSPFAPNGLTGVLQGVSAVFFAYIGFDALSTTSEECVNPQRDLPRWCMYIFCCRGESENCGSHVWHRSCNGKGTRLRTERWPECVASETLQPP